MHAASHIMHFKLEWQLITYVIGFKSGRNCKMISVKFDYFLCEKIYSNNFPSSTQSLQWVGIWIKRHMKMKVLVSQSCPTFATPWTVACQPPLSLGFFRQEYWNGLPFPSPGDLPNPGIEPRSTVLQADSLLSEPPWQTKMAYELNYFLCEKYTQITS